MSDTRALLNDIAALRQRLQQAQGLADSANSAAASLLDNAPEGPARVSLLERRVNDGACQTALLDGALRHLRSVAGVAEPAAVLPSQLTARAHRLVKAGRDLLGKLRALADESALQDAAAPLAVRYRETVAMAYTALQTVQAYPDSPSAQLRLCDGFEATLEVVAERLAVLQAAIAHHRRAGKWMDTLASLLKDLDDEQALELTGFVQIAEELIDEARQGGLLRFLHAGVEEPARFVAAHCLTVAQVMIRLLRHDGEFRDHLVEAVVAALVHDVGMLRVPVEILGQPSPVSDEQKRTIEGHAHAGADLLRRAFPNEPALAETAAAHHERLDGTGYPAGLRDVQIKPLTRALTVCDVYAALCSPRPHRAAAEPRTALTDTLLLAEQGALDRFHAERLLQLSFYPAGAVVELADGRVGLVLAAQLGRRDLNAPARPVVALLTDERGRALPILLPLDLSQTDGPAIVRTLTTDERRRRLGRRYPEWA